MCFVRCGCRMWVVSAGLILLAALGDVSCFPRDTFMAGAVLAESGDVKEMLHAKRGYMLGAHAVNELSGGKGFSVKDVLGNEYYFKFDFNSLNDESDKEQHDRMLHSLLEEDQVDFLLGSHAKFALEETNLANLHERINIHCCVGPDSIYEQDLPYVFGIQGSNKKYPQPTMQSMALRGISRLSVIWKEDNPFTKSTCEAALELAQSTKGRDDETMEVMVEEAYSDESDTGVFERFAEECIKKGVEAVVACTLSDDGADLVEVFHSRKKSMKAFFMTVGPTHPEWVQDEGEKADFMLSAGQWHDGLFYSDLLFGNTGEYKEKYQKHFNGNVPTYIGAGASVTVYTIVRAIQDAFVDCDISQTGGDVDQLLFNSSALSCEKDQKVPNNANGYERVRLTLEDVDLDTFFGRIKFNEFRRNIGCDPATVQVLPDRNNSRDIHIVYPGRAVNAELRMPGENKYKLPCGPGYFMGRDEFNPCVPCEPGTFSDNYNSPHCDRCPSGSYTSEGQGKNCTVCPQGTMTDGPGANNAECCHCIPGFYNTQGKSGMECSECPFGAVCNGGMHLPFPIRGYWMNDTMRDMAHECDSETVCIGGPELACSAGYTGRMCSECSEGYYGVLSNCNKCPPKSVVISFIVLVVLGWYMINVVVSKSVASLEMMLSWAQLANVIGDVRLRWPQSLQVMFGVANLLDFDVDILEPSCLTTWSFKHNHVVQLCLPFLMSLMASLGYLSSWIVHRCGNKLSTNSADRLNRWLGWLVTIPHSEEELCAKWDATIATFLSSIEVTYITVAKYCCDVFKCENIGGVSVLRTAPSIECGTHEHRTLMVVGSLGTIVYSIGYLAFVSWKIWQLHAHRTFQETQNLRRYGFLYRRFELTYCWSSIVILGRRLLFVMVLVFVNNPGFQAGALAIIINASLILHVYTAPYVETYLDVLFSFLLVALMFESFSGVLFYSTNLPGANRVILEWIVLVILYILVAISAYFLLAELKRKYENHVVRRMHYTQIMCTKYDRCTTSPWFSFVSREGRDAKKLIDKGVMGTFDSSFLYTALKNHPEHMKNWDKLDKMLKDFMCCQSECSYLSRDPVAKFWRKLVNRFPELVDFLAVANEESREHFTAFATTLYQGFYLTNKIEQLPICGILNWRDRAPMAQWLAMAGRKDREFFTSFMSDLFQSVGRDPIPAFDEKVVTEVSAATLDINHPSQNDARTANRRKLTRVGSSKEMAIAELTSGRNPLEFKRRPSWKVSGKTLKDSIPGKSKGGITIPDMKSVPEDPEDDDAQSSG